jgi:hypothetical protein
MKMFSKRMVPLVGMVLVLVVSITGCSSLKQIADALNGLGRLQFKLDNVSGFQLNNSIDLGSLNSVSDVSIMQAAGLVAAFQQKRMPASFTVNVLAKNPNNGTNGKSATDLYLSKIAWTLLIDDKTTISGVTEKNLMIPASGQSISIPMTFSLDLFQFFGDKGYEDMINLALAIGGRSGSSSRLKLTARITATVLGQSVTYPNDITIVNSQFSNP